MIFQNLSIFDVLCFELCLSTKWFQEIFPEDLPPVETASRRRLGFRTAEVQGGSWHDVQDFMVKVDKMFVGWSMVC